MSDLELSDNESIISSSDDNDDYQPTFTTKKTEKRIIKNFNDEEDDKNDEDDELYENNEEPEDVNEEDINEQESNDNEDIEVNVSKIPKSKLPNTTLPTTSIKIPSVFEKNDEDYVSDSDEEEDDDYLQKFDKELHTNYILNEHPESLIHNYDEVYNLAKVERNTENTIIDDLHKTIPILTKYERTKVLGLRAKQLNNGAKPYVKLNSDIIDGYLIALKELEEKKIPFIIRRPLPNGGSEYWHIQDLEII